MSLKILGRSYNAFFVTVVFFKMLNSYFGSPVYLANHYIFGNYILHDDDNIAKSLNGVNISSNLTSIGLVLQVYRPPVPQPFHNIVTQL